MVSRLRGPAEPHRYVAKNMVSLERFPHRSPHTERSIFLLRCDSFAEIVPTLAGLPDGNFVSLIIADFTRSTLEDLTKLSQCLIERGSTLSTVTNRNHIGVARSTLTFVGKYVRHLFRFRLRTIFIALCLIAGTLGWIAQNQRTYNYEQILIRQLEEVTGPICLVDFETSAGSSIRIYYCSASAR